MKKPINNPHHIPKWNEVDHARLLVSYYHTYQNSFNSWEHEILSQYRPKADRVWFSRITHYGGKKIKWFLLHELYLEGHKVYQILKCDFVEFCNYMIYGIPHKIYKIIPQEDKYPFNYYYWRWRARSDLRDIHFRAKQKFVQTGQYKPKEKTDHQKAKEEWHKYKRHDRDKRKSGYSRMWSCPKSMKKMCNKQHRQWQRDNINKDNWEELMDYKSLKRIQDPWKWY